eukprot:15258187-Alexandrium_andersonii.AAC.1
MPLPAEASSGASSSRLRHRRPRPGLSPIRLRSADVQLVQRACMLRRIHPPWLWWLKRLEYENTQACLRALAW